MTESEGAYYLSMIQSVSHLSFRHNGIRQAAVFIDKSAELYCH